MHRSLSTTIKRLLIAALTVLSGATLFGCSDGGSTKIGPGPGPVMYGPAPMYGVRMATFVVKGQVTNQDGTPIAGIHITVTDTNPNDQWAAVVTDAGGNYEFDNAAFSGGEVVTVTASDVDGTANGGDFAGADKTPDVPAITLGATDTETVNFTLDPKP